MGTPLDVAHRGAPDPQDCEERDYSGDYEPVYSRSAVRAALRATGLTVVKLPGDVGYLCNHCNYYSPFEFELKEHVDRKHSS